MSENSTIPYVLQLKDAVNAIHLSENDISNIGLSLSEPANITIVPSFCQTVEQVCIPAAEVVQKVVDTGMEVEPHNANEQVNFVYEIVYPEQLNLKPTYNLKRGRPKKKKVEEPVPEPPKSVKPAPRTRSGRVVKFPKYIEQDFKKVETDDGPLHLDEQEIKTSEFIRFEDDNRESKKISEIQLEFHQRKRKISAQYRCPKCKKAYLGKTKMMQHIKKYPDHGPLPHDELNFDVWNYLVDITQKSAPAQRGVKFCEELTNLLHNVLLLTSALFKKAELNKSHVDVDKVLGNAIGLPPGPYKFNDSELYKDVTIMKLITNSDFFKPVDRDEPEVSSNLDAGDEVKENVVNVSSNKSSDNAENTVCNDTEMKTGEDKADLYFRPQENVFSATKTENDSSGDAHCKANTENGSVTDNFVKCNVETSPNANFVKKSQPLDNRLHVHTDLLSDNSLLNLPNLRNSVDELILSGVDSSTNLLDNSTSSDEVMNVDQFVNERFKKITEPETEISTAGLNLDLPTLDLFQFHTN